MKYLIQKTIIIMAIIIPSVLLSACSEKKDVIHVSSKSKVWLGVQVKNIPERRLDNLKVDYGLEVMNVYKDSPAEKAGLLEGDILLEINGSPLEDVSELSDIIQDTKIDEKVTIKYIRDGKKTETEATMSKRNRRIIAWDGKAGKQNHFVFNKTHSWLGVSTTGLTDQLRQFFNVPDYLGVLVREVEEDSPAEKHGLKAGDVIIQVGRKEIEDSHDLIRAIDRYDPGEEVEVKIIRDKKEVVLKVTLGERKGHYPNELSFHPDKFDVYVPEMEIEIPEIDIVIPEIDEESLENLHELNDRLRDELDSHKDELKEELEELKEELKEIKVYSHPRKSAVI